MITNFIPTISRFFLLTREPLSIKCYLISQRRERCGGASTISPRSMRSSALRSPPLLMQSLRLLPEAIGRHSKSGGVPLSLELLMRQNDIYSFGV